MFRPDNLDRDGSIIELLPSLERTLENFNREHYAAALLGRTEQYHEYESGKEGERVAVFPVNADPGDGWWRR
jgi:hypothetical protein